MRFGYRPKPYLHHQIFKLKFSYMLHVGYISQCTGQCNDQEMLDLIFLCTNRLRFRLIYIHIRCAESNIYFRVRFEFWKKNFCRISYVIVTFTAIVLATTLWTMNISNQSCASNPETLWVLCGSALNCQSSLCPTLSVSISFTHPATSLASLSWAYDALIHFLKMTEIQFITWCLLGAHNLQRSSLSTN